MPRQAQAQAKKTAKKTDKPTSDKKQSNKSLGLGLGLGLGIPAIAATAGALYAGLRPRVVVQDKKRAKPSLNTGFPQAAQTGTWSNTWTHSTVRPGVHIFHHHHNGANNYTYNRTHVHHSSNGGQNRTVFNGVTYTGKFDTVNVINGVISFRLKGVDVTSKIKRQT
jgi:hypothetical protein